MHSFLHAVRSEGLMCVHSWRHSRPNPEYCLLLFAIFAPSTPGIPMLNTIITTHTHIQTTCTNPFIESRAIANQKSRESGSLGEIDLPLPCSSCG